MRPGKKYKKTIPGHICLQISFQCYFVHIDLFFSLSLNQYETALNYTLNIDINVYNPSTVKKDTPVIVNMDFQSLQSDISYYK